MERGLARAVAVGLGGQRDVADVAAQALQRGEQAIALDRERAVVVVGRAVDHEERLVDLVGEPERRHLIVDLCRLPVGALLGLEAERGQRPVVRARAGDAGEEQVAVGMKPRSCEYSSVLCNSSPTSFSSKYAGNSRQPIQG